MKLSSKPFILAFILLSFLSNNLHAQSSVCDSITPSFFVDLTGDPDSNYISPPVVREGICCNLTITAPPPRCIEFEVTLDTGAVGLAFDIYSGAEPPGALFYQVNCGALVPIGDTICLDGIGPHTLTFCKPGANQNEYTLRSIPGTLIPETNNTRAGCETEVGVTGLIESTIRWRDVSSPNQLYQSYLSCDSGCDTVYVITPQNAPLFVDYEVCGTPIANFCADSLPDICDTIRVFISPPLDIQINPNPPVICLNEGVRTLRISTNLDRTNFTYEWYGGPGGSGPLLGTDSTLTVSAAGSYSIVVEDTIFGECSRDTTTGIVTFAAPPVVTALRDTALCLGDSVPLQALGALNYRWSPSMALDCDTCSQVMASPNTSRWYYVEGLDANGCRNEDSVFIEVFYQDSTNINLSICPGDSILLGGLYRDTAGFFRDTLQNQHGCDSILLVNLSLYPSYTLAIDTSICLGDSIFLAGDYRDSIGVYTDSLLSVDGCDSLILYNLRLLPTYELNLQASICQGDSLFIAGAFRASSGIYIDSLLSVDGCDSLILTSLSVFPTYVDSQQTSICQGDSILLGGEYRSLSGVYTDSLASANGCDSLIVTTLNILPTYNQTQQRSICQGDSVLIGGIYQNTAGIYIDSLLTAAGCDSILSVELLILPTYSQSQQASICEGDSIFLGGSFQSLAGVYTDSLLSVNDCDSLILTTLSVFPAYVDSQQASICQGDSILLGGVFQSLPGVYTDSLLSIDGCDSLVLTSLIVFPTYLDSQQLSICQGDSILLAGTFQSLPGVYTDSLLSINGCDSLTVTILDVLPTYDQTQQRSICQGDSVLIGGIYRNTAGIYTDSLLTVAGCDSILSIDLLILPSYSQNQQASICEGDSIFLGGAFRRLAGIYTDSLLSVNGCDSLILTTLTVFPTYVDSQQASICEGDSILLGGVFQSLAGVYTDSLLSVDGCDSLILTSLSVFPIYVDSQQASICQGDSILLGGVYRSLSGVYTDSLASANGCDSLIVTTLNILPTYNQTQQRNICQGDSVLIGGIYRTAAGVYTDSLLTAAGCDSILSVELLILPSYNQNQQASICEGDSIFLGGAFQRLAGVYTDSLLSVDGCDSLILTNLSVFSTYVDSQQASICEGDSILLGGVFQSLAGVYTDSLLSVDGCDSLVLTRLDIIPTIIEERMLEICEGDSIMLAGNYYSQAAVVDELFTSSLGCDSILRTEIEVLPQPDLEVIEDQDICVGEGVSLWARGSNDIRWSPAEGLNCTNCNNPIATPSRSITYRIEIPGCGNRLIIDSVRITVHDPPVVDAGLDQEILQGESIELIAGVLPPDSVRLFWESNQDGILCDPCSSITVSPEFTQTYRVTAIDSFGCTDMDLVEIKVKTDCVTDLVEIPNLITPNGDGINDQFYIRNLGPGLLKIMRIYNRWGQKVFETNDINTRWDGSFRGASCNPGVFAYYFEISCPNEETIIVSGDLTLLK